MKSRASRFGPANVYEFAMPNFVGCVIPLRFRLCIANALNSLKVLAAAPPADYSDGYYRGVKRNVHPVMEQLCI